LPSRLATLGSLRTADVLWLQREALPFGPPMLERFVRARFAKPYVYDFDDAIWMTPDANESRLVRWLRNRGKVKTLIRRAAHVFAGNAFLADYARQFNPNVTVIPTVVDTETRYVAQHDHHHGAAPVVGWTGSRSTLTYLDLLRPVLADLARDHEFHLDVVCDRAPGDLGVPVRFRPWSAETELRDLLRFDVGVMPLLDRPWERGKCGFKVIQYMACGIPPVAADVGVNREIVRHGVDGFLCRDDDDWRTALTTLLGDPDRRAAMGRNARARIVEHYSVHSQAPRIAAIFREVAAAHGGG